MGDREISADLTPLCAHRSWSAQLMTASARWLPLAVVLVAIAAVSVHRFDLAIQRALAVNEPNPLARLVQITRIFGKADVQIVLALLAAWCGRRQAATRALVGLGVVAVVILPLKYAIARTRPDGGGYSFPSGDVASVVALLAPFALTLPGRLLAVAGTLVIALGRIIDNRHYPSDTLAAIAVGLIAVQIAPAIVPIVVERIGRRTWGIACLVVSAGALAYAHWFDRHSSFPIFIRVFAPAIALVAFAAWQSERPATRSEPRRAWLSAIAMAAGAAALCAVLAASSSLWDRDEPRFATAAVEMLRSGNWLYPTFNGELRPDKPILIYWLMAVALKLFGTSALAARTWAPLAAATSVLITFVIARRMVDARAGLWAAAVLATSPLLIACGSAATTDAVLLALILGAIAVGLSLRQQPGSWPLTCALAFLLGAALLVKGPVGLVVPLVALAGSHWLERRQARAGSACTGGHGGRSPTKQTANSPAEPIMEPLVQAWPGGGRIAIAAAIGVLIFVAWGVPANSATHGAFVEEGIGRHVLERSVRPLEAHGGDFITHLPYYLGIIAVAFFPWTLFLPGACVHTDPRVRALVLGWTLPVLTLFTLVATKLPHYALPLFPALALAVGARLAAEDFDVERSGRRLQFFGTWLMAGVGTVLALALAVSPWLEPLARRLQIRADFTDFLAMLTPLRLPALGAALVVAVMTIAAARVRTAACAARIMVASMAMLTVVLAFEAMPAIELLKASPRLAAAIRARTADDVPVTTCGYIEPSLNFYLGRRIERRGVGNLPTWLAMDGPGVLVIDRQRLLQIQDRLGSVRLELLAREFGLTNSAPTPVELFAFGRHLPASGGVMTPAIPPPPVPAATARNQDSVGATESLRPPAADNSD